MMACTEHDTADPDGCFACKMDYWRGRSAPMQFTFGRDEFHGPTVRERQRRDLEEYRKAGMTHVEPVGSRWV